MSARVQIRVTPRAKVNALEGPDAAGVYKLRLNAPPVDGKANDACIRYLAEALRVPRSSVRIVSGETARLKLIEVAGIDDAALAARLREVAH